MTDNNQLHVVFGTGPVGMAVMDELVSRGTRVRMVDRSGRAKAQIRRVVGVTPPPLRSPGGQCGASGRYKPNRLRKVARAIHS